MLGLCAVLLEQEQEHAWQTYVADMLWISAKGVAPKLQIKPYSTLINPHKKPVDDRTGNEILQDVKAQLMSRISAREEAKK